MNRLTYWIMADSQYRIHSPFLFEMYRKVLFAELDREMRHGLEQQCGIEPCADRRCRAYHDIVLKLCDHYRLRVLCYDEDEAVLEGPSESFGTVKVVCRPHHCRARELRWEAQKRNEKYHVSIDLFDVGLLLTNPRLHPQHFILR